MIKLVSLNIERSKHLDLVLPFLQAQNADVVCLLELAERDIPRFEEMLGPCVYQVGGLHPADPPETEPLFVGKGFFTKLPVVMNDVRYYRGDIDHARHGTPNVILGSSGLIACDVEKDSERFRIIATHFTWTPHGEPSDEQRIDLEAMFQILHEYKQFILVGDFNAPRGGELFTKLSDHYFDNIPAYYRTSLDINFHVAAKERPSEITDRMVDGFFTTTDYRVQDANLVFGLSDHAAVVGTISKA